MQFLYEPLCGGQTLQLESENYNYLVKARRCKEGDEISLRNLIDEFLYSYKIVSISKKSVQLELIYKAKSAQIPSKKLNIIWCLVDPKTVEKELPALNQIGISKISFVKCDFSQGNFEPNLERLKKILVNSCMQCGRTNLMELEIISKKEMMERSFAILDFSPEKIGKKIWEFDTFLIGPEGGFSQKEKETFSSIATFGFDTNLILRSETAVSTFGAIYLLGNY